MKFCAFLLIAVLLSLSFHDACADTSTESMVLYLREGCPENGQPFKPYQPDAGRLLTTPPQSLEEVWCGIWAQYDFDDVLDKPLTVERVYVRVWLYSVNGKGKSAFHFDGGYDDKVTPSTVVEIKPKNARARAYRYDLYCYNLNFEKPIVLDPKKPYSEDGSAYRFTYKWLAPANQPITASRPGMVSFIWLNPPSEEKLKRTDSDKDGLSDFAEISDHFTNPFEKDTDADGIPDANEIKRGLDPNNSDTDFDSVPDRKDKEPKKAGFDEILDKPRIRKDVSYVSKRLLVRGGLSVKDGATARFKNCEIILEDGDDTKAFIAVTKGSKLSAERSTFRSRDGRTLYFVEINGRVEMKRCTISDAYIWRLKSDKNIFRNCRFDYNYKTFEIEGSDNLFEKCDFDHAHFGIHIYMKGEARNNVIRACTFDHALFSAIELHEGATGNIIEDCEITRSDHAVVLKSKPGRNIVRKCRFRLNNSSVSLSSPENIVEENHFSEKAWAHITFGNGSRNIIRKNTILNAEISLWDNCNENIFEENLFEDIPGKAVLLKNGASRNVFRENTFKNIGGPCVVICKDCNENEVEGSIIIPPCGPIEIHEGALNNIIRIRARRRKLTRR